MATCQSCYKRVPEGAPHCPHCGATQPQPEGKKTVFGYAATDQLPQLAETQQAAPAPEAPEAMAKTMFAGSGSGSSTAEAKAPAPAEKPAPRAPKVRMPQVDPALKRPLRDPTSPKPAVAGQETEGRPPSQPSVVPPKANAVPPTMAVSPKGAATPPRAAVPPTMAAPTPAPQAVPPTMAAPTPAPQAVPPTMAAPTPAPLAAPRPASAPARVNRASTTLYLVFILGGILLTGGLTGLAVANLSHMHELLYFSWMPAILTGIFFLVLIYKAWGALQDGQTPITPGKAVGFLFIPLFNIYWIFVGIGGWARQYNAYLERHRISAPRASEGLFIAYPVCCLVPLAAPVALVLLILVVAKMCNGINTIAGARG